MAPSKSSIFTIVAPIVISTAIIRPPNLQVFVDRLNEQVHSGNYSGQVIAEWTGRVWRSPGTTFLLYYALFTALVYVLAKLYRAFTEPLAVYCDEPRIGYQVEGSAGGKTEEERVRDLKRQRTVGKVPPLYPNGWMSVLRSPELRIGETKPVRIAGKNLAVFRGESGRSYIVDAYCVHLGANLATGGSVHGDCIECPFHGWRYRGEDGKCVKIGYAEKVPEFAKIQTYHSCEKNERIYFWFHAEGKEPYWEVPEIDGLAGGRMQYVGFTQAEFDGHTEDVSENGADIAHLDYLHSPRGATGTSKFVDCDWVPDSERKHVAAMIIPKHENKKLLGFIPLPSMSAKVEQIGPCFAHFDMRHGLLGRLIFILSATPIGPLRQRIVTTTFAERGLLPFYLGKKVLMQQYYQLEADILVWSNKMYMDNPMLVKEDHLIAKHRRFYAQFYSENSPKLNPKANQTI